MGPPGMRIINENGPDERNPRRGPHRAESVSMTLRRGQTAAFGIMAVGFIVTTGSPSSAATHAGERGEGGRDAPGDDRERDQNQEQAGHDRGQGSHSPD